MSDEVKAERQFVKCQFNPWDRRNYTYHNDGERLAVGDMAKVPSPNGDKIVEVVGLTDDQPSFETKGVIEKVEKRPEDESEVSDGQK